MELIGIACAKCQARLDYRKNTGSNTSCSLRLKPPTAEKRNRPYHIIFWNVKGKPQKGQICCFWCALLGQNDVSSAAGVLHGQWVHHIYQLKLPKVISVSILHMIMFSNFKSWTIKIQGLLHQLASIKPKYKSTSYFCVTNHWSKYKGELQWTCLELRKPTYRSTEECWHVMSPSPIPLGCIVIQLSFSIYFAVLLFATSQTNVTNQSWRTLYNTLYTIRCKYYTKITDVQSNQFHIAI